MKTYITHMAMSNNQAQSEQSSQDLLIDSNHPIEIQNEINGGYFGCNAGFASGTWRHGAEKNYNKTLLHLIKVLSSIDSTLPGSDYWGHKGIHVNYWLHQGKEVVPRCSNSLHFGHLDTFLSFLNNNNIIVDFTQND